MKKISNCMYVHKSNINELLNNIPYMEAQRISKIISDKNSQWNFEVIKYDVKQKKLSLIQSGDWDTANEPTVGDSLIINIITFEEKIIVKRKNEQIYHQKELFVSDNYKGFDIEKAKERTKLWKSIPNIKEHLCKIGYRSYWNQLLDEYNIEK